MHLVGLICKITQGCTVNIKFHRLVTDGTYLDRIHLMRHLTTLAGQSFTWPRCVLLQNHDSHLLTGNHAKAYQQRRMAPHMKARSTTPILWYLHSREVIAYHLNLHNPTQRLPAA